VDEIAKLHDLPESEWAELDGEMPPEFNAMLYRWEQNYFFENFLGRIFGLNEGRLRKIASLPALENIAERLAELPRVLVHRDFQSQNIIARSGHAYLIDFQGMRPGVAEYDLASLLFDPYVRFSANEREELYSYYMERRGLLSTPQMREILRLCAMQRLMQALGAYGFLGLVKGNRHFLAHVPAALDSLRNQIADIDLLEPLGAALACLPKNGWGNYRRGLFFHPETPNPTAWARFFQIGWCGPFTALGCLGGDAHRQRRSDDFQSFHRPRPALFSA